MSKIIRLGRQSYRLAGDADDPYYAMLGDGADDDLGEFLHRHLGAEAVAVDVGANIGVTTLLMSQVVPMGTVVAVEAGRRNFALLSENLDANGCSNVHRVFAAVSSRAGTVHFSENTAYGGVLEGVRLGGTGYVVDAITVDDLVLQRSLERVDLIKIDVEGHEAEVLAGAEATIDRFNPIVVLEFNLWTIMAYSDDNPLRVLRELVAGFEYVGRILRDGSLARIGPEDVVGFVHDCLTTGDCVHNLGLRRTAEGFPPPRDDDDRPSASEMERTAPEPIDDSTDTGPDSSSAVAQRDAAIRERDDLRSELDRLEEQYNAVVNSRSWRFTEPIRRFGRRRATPGRTSIEDG